MFTQRRSGAQLGSSRSKLIRTGGFFGAVALAAGIGIIAPTAAQADEVDTSYAEGRFLSGSLVGIDLDQIVELAAARAANDGTQPLQTSKDPLSASVLQTVDVDAPGGVQLDLGQFLDAGVINQYAEAEVDGVAMASSGAIGDDGAIGVGEVGAGSAGDLTLDLDALINSRFASILTDVKLSLEAVAAQARGTQDTASGDYTLAGATLTFSSPAVGSLTNKVNGALATVDQSLLGLEGDDGVLGNAVDGVLDPVLGVVGSSADVTATIDVDLQEAVRSLLNGAYGDGAVSFNLETGAVSVDLEALLGGELNDLAPNTELLTDAVINQVLVGVTDTVSTLADQIVDRVEAALHNAHVEVHADLDLLTSQGSTQTEVCHLVDVPIIGDILPEGGVVDDLLGGLLGGGGSGSGDADGVTRGIIGYTTETVCDLVDTLLPSLKSTVDVDIVATVDQLLSGAAASADASVSLLGGTVNADVNVDLILSQLALALDGKLFGSDSTVSDFVDALNSGLVHPAVTGLLGDGSVDTVLTDLVSVKVNVQETHDGSFTETAVRVTVLGDLGEGGAATVNLAAATVGPNVTRVIDPGCTVNCGGGSDPDPDPCVSNCGGGGGTPPAGSTPAGFGGNLAMTGIAIGTLIMLVLGLLATGAILLTEGYRRNHARVLA